MARPSFYFGRKRGLLCRAPPSAILPSIFVQDGEPYKRKIRDLKRERSGAQFQFQFILLTTNQIISLGRQQYMQSKLTQISVELGHSSVIKKEGRKETYHRKKETYRRVFLPCPPCFAPPPLFLCFLLRGPVLCRK